MFKYHKRHAESAVKHMAELFPIVGVLGPRQSGKTTLTQHMFKHLPYVSFEDPKIRLKAQQDTEAFLKEYAQTGALFDEAQYVPDLFSYIQLLVDQTPRPGHFILTGSNNFILDRRIKQALVGRIGLLTLLPFSMAEIQAQDALSFMLKGGYPPLHIRDMPTHMYYGDYLHTYLERDVRRLESIDGLVQFHLFLGLCAHKTGQIFDAEAIAAELKVSVITIKKWLSVLANSYIVFLLLPSYEKSNRRKVRQPRLYFYDSGVLCYLLNIEKLKQLERPEVRDVLYENLVISELVKMRQNQGKDSKLYFWHDAPETGRLCLAHWDGEILAFKVVSDTEVKEDMLQELNMYHAVEPNAKRYLIYNGNKTGEFMGTQLVPITQLDAIS